MTQFTKQNILTSGDSIYFAAEGVNTPWTNRKFLARFKHRGPVTKAKFIKTLTNNYSVEQYLGRLEGGEAPLEVLMNDNILIFNHETRKFTLEGKTL